MTRPPRSLLAARVFAALAVTACAAFDEATEPGAIGFGPVGATSSRFGAAR